MLARAELEAVADRLVRGRPHLVRAPRLEQLPLPEREPHVRAEELVRRADQHVDVPGRDVDRPVRRVVDGVGPGERAGGVRELDDARTSGAVPTEFAATGKATTRVRSESCRLEIVVVELEIVVQRRRRGRRRPRSCASSSHGETLASWSSAVTTISSPSRSVRANARVRRKLSAVMLCPNAVSPGEQPRNDAGRLVRERRRAPSCARLVSYGAPMFALSSRR